MSPEAEADFVTINPAVAYNRFCVLVMRYDHSQREHVIARCSDPLPRPAAESLAASWAAAMQLEVR